MKNTDNYKQALFLCLLFTLAPLLLSAQAKFHSLDLQLPFAKEKQRLTVEVRDGLVFLEGDIILGRAEELFNPHEKAVAISGQDYRWENGIIPYVIESGHPMGNQIIDAIQHVNEHTNLELRPRSADEDYVMFVNGNECASSVGRQRGRQDIIVGPCSFGTIVHEICHAAGLYHEQSRSDRDHFITINWNNIRTGRAGQFQKRSDSFDFGDYDYNSIMHYGPKAFGCRRCADGKTYCDLGDCPTVNCSGCVQLETIAVKTPPAAAGTTIGQRNGLSNGDIAVLNAMYPCSGPYQKNVCGAIQGLYPGEQNVFARHTIHAADNGCTTFVIPMFGSSINWRSGRRIVFHPGSQVKSASLTNAHFRAYIKSCPNPFLDESFPEETAESASHQTSDPSLTSKWKEKTAGAALSLKIYPNPFKSQTTIAFDLPETMPVQIRIYNPIGKVVYEIQSDFPAGYNESTFENTQNLPPGVYFVHFQASTWSETRQIVLGR